MKYEVTNIRYFDATYGAPADESLRVQVETLDELRAVPWIRSIEEKPEFHRWSYIRDELRVNEGAGKERLIVDTKLMAEFKGGAEWWVVANLPHDFSFGLPKWEPKAG